MPTPSGKPSKRTRPIEDEDDDEDEKQRLNGEPRPRTVNRER
jgi:hypothetical protein